MAKAPFSKPALNLDEQVALLQERGLQIDDSEKAKHYLNFIGYYRLSGYFRYFSRPDDDDREQFREGVSFQNALDLYIFDRKLRVLLMDAFERIEIALKAAMSNSVATREGAFWLCDPKNFDYGMHNKIEDEIRKALAMNDGRSQHLFINHFYSKYDDQFPPSWMIFEGMSFGGVSRIYKLMKGQHRQLLSAVFHVQHGVLESWLHSLTFGRNVCAHNARIWNRKFTIKPKIPRGYQSVWPATSQDRLYVLCCIIKHLMDVLSDGSQWPQRLRALINERPNVPLNSMGFPDDWETYGYWGFAET